jgi:hypothetical protein
MGRMIVIVGASADRAKYGNKAVRAYLRKGWTVYPVNPNAKEVEGIPSYASVADIPGPIDRISFYVPPKRGLGMLAEVAAKSPTEVFLNPGSESSELIKEAKLLGLNPIQACSIVNIGLHPEQFPDQ